MSEPFPLLFSPLKIGPVESRNRIINAGHGTSLAPGHHNEALFSYEEERARGGAGIVCTQSQWINPRVGDFDIRYEVESGAYETLASRVHRHGALCWIQMNHPGRQGTLGAPGRDLAYAPSQVAGRYYGHGVQIPHAMTEREIHAAIDDFAECAELIADTAADGIEAHFGHGNLVQQFLSPATNTRTDSWGGSFDSRTRLAREIVQAIRDRIGSSGQATVAFGVRINAAEPGDPAETEELLRFAEMLGSLPGLDYLSVTGGHFSSTWGTAFNLPDSSFRPALWEEYGYQIKKAAQIPVFLVGRITGPELAESLLEKGACDGVAMVRELIADPQLPNKSRTGQSDRIRPCVGIQSGCWQRGAHGYAIHCAFNPEAGREVEARENRPAAVARAQRVTVVSAGPAGLEAARWAAELGHDVTLLEAADHVGGQTALTARTPHRADLNKVNNWFLAECVRGGVDIRTSTPATARIVLDTQPDVVVIATGIRAPSWITPDVPDATIDAWQLLAGSAKPEGRVIVYDDLGGRTALSTAEFLADMGCPVEFVTSLSIPGEGLDGTVRGPQVSGLAKAGTSFRCESTLLSRRAGMAAFRDDLSEQEYLIEGVDLLVTVLRPSSNDDLARQLDGHVPRLFIVGDALAPRGITEATHDGHLAAVACGLASSPGQ